MRLKPYFVVFTILAVTGTCGGQSFHPNIPRAWDDREVARLEAPLAQRDRPPRYLTAGEYYAQKVRRSTVRIRFILPAASLMDISSR